MKLISLFLTNLKTDFLFLKIKNLNFREKIKYLLQKYYCLFFNKKEIRIKNKKFKYDNYFTPQILQTYFFEYEELSKNINFNNICSILDIGANIGQFSFVGSLLYKKLKFFSFEPNKNIFPILKKNSKTFPNWKTYNLGISNKKKSKLYYIKNKSGVGSIYKENVMPIFSLNKKINEISVKNSNLSKKELNKMNLNPKIDFIKIDVEGYELNIIKLLKDIDFKYLYIEVSNKRKGYCNGKKFIKILKKNYIYNNFNLIYSSKKDIECVCYSIIIEKK